LERVSYLLRELGDPQRAFRAIHVTGTSGKGSTTAMAAPILGAAGYRVGMYTSPHLSSFTERIVVDGRPIGVEEVVGLLEEVRPMAAEMASTKLDHPTFFEVSTAIAFKHFQERNVDLAVVEVGMGGRLDATNVLEAPVAVITNVGLEHTKYLGETVVEIAREKAGIVKRGSTLITAADQPKVLRLLGRHQLRNASCAVGAVEALSLHGVEVPEEAIGEGLRRARWPGRLEVVQGKPLTVLDCAKDPRAMENLVHVVPEEFSYRRLIAVVSISRDKEIPRMIRALAGVADHFILTRHGVMGRAAEPEALALEVERYSKPYEIVEGVEEAVRRAMERAGEGDLILVTGSVFTVGEARELGFRPLAEI